MAGPVSFVTLDRQHAALRDELRAAYDRVVAASGFILGAEVEGFEREFAEYCGVPHCVAVNSGTAALTIALAAAGIGAGDEVIVPAHTYIASALGVVHAGATPVFCDVTEATGLIDPAAAAQVVGHRTTAILAVHLYGQICDMEGLGAVARRHGLALFEDAAQAHGATWRGRRAGGLAVAAGFSFYPSKNLGALGDGGAVCTADAGIAQRARALRNIGQRAKGEHVMVGYNERLDGLQAAFLRVKLPRLDAWNAARRSHAATYGERLAERVAVLPEPAGSECVYHLYPVRTENRSALVDRLHERGVQTGVHYSPAVPDQPPFRRLGRLDDVPVARRWAAQELSLPMAPELTDEEVRSVADLVLSATDRR